jgi:hypothetical protein
MAYRMEFDHRHDYERDSHKGISVPLLISANGFGIRLSAKLDTGADYCLFDRKWADLLRIDVELGPRRIFSGLAGRFEAFEHEVVISAFDLEFASQVYFTGEVDAARDLLGRNGWLDHFRVAIVHYDREIFLSPTERYS